MITRRSRAPAAVGVVALLTALAGTVPALPATPDGATGSAERPPAARMTPRMLDALPALPGDLGALPAVSVPADNPQTAAKVDLGAMLFFDKRLSLDRSMSCATCHNPRKGYADGRALAIGFGGKVLGRHTPTVLNAAYSKVQFWDGRAGSLEEQAAGPIQAAGEMNLPGEELAARLGAVPEYRRRFQEVFGEAPSLQRAASAIAAFERTLVTPDSRFDAYARGDKRALTPIEKRGLVLFMGKAACSQCHNGPNLSDDEFHVLGPTGRRRAGGEDVGRYAVTKDERDVRAFKTPTLRNVTLTAPYMHDGSLRTLEAVVDFYDRGGGDVPNRSVKLVTLHLTRQEKRDLIAFLRTLTGTRPTLPAVKPPADHAGGEPR